jgi:hypothetical protein
VNFGARSDFKKNCSHGYLKTGVDYSKAGAVEFNADSENCWVCEIMKGRIENYEEIQTMENEMRDGS